MTGLLVDLGMFQEAVDAGREPESVLNTAYPRLFPADEARRDEFCRMRLYSHLADAYKGLDRRDEEREYHNAAMALNHRIGTNE